MKDESWPKTKYKNTVVGLISSCRKEQFELPLQTPKYEGRFSNATVKFSFLCVAMLHRNRLAYIKASNFCPNLC